VSQLAATDLAHTMEHIDCVVAPARYISLKEGASTKITIPTGHFHDSAPREPAMHHMHTFNMRFTPRRMAPTCSDINLDRSKQRSCETRIYWTRLVRGA